MYYGFNGAHASVVAVAGSVACCMHVMLARYDCIAACAAAAAGCVQEGPLALYKGWVPSVIGVVPYVGLNFGVYETLKAMTLQHYGRCFARSM